MSGAIKIFLVDDHRLFRDGLKRLLASDARFEVVGEASSGAEFLEAAEAAEVDLVFMDIDMPGPVSGIEATRQAVERWPEMRVVALSMHGEEEFYAPMMEAGAAGFLMKDSEFERVVAAALEAVGGDRGEWSAGDQEGWDAANEEGIQQLSEREKEVLPLICEGLSTQQIAEKLFISKRTVDKHRANILAKTGCHNTAGLVMYSVKNQLIEL